MKGRMKDAGNVVIIYACMCNQDWRNDKDSQTRGYTIDMKEKCSSA